MEVYRISRCEYINDLSGKGAALFGGRWNSKDVYIIYTAENRALAMLESMVHLNKIPKEGFCIATLFLPDNCFEICQVSILPNSWDCFPAPDVLKKIGDNFISTNKSLALKIPSVIIKEDSNFLINPHHRDFTQVKIISVRPLKFDERLH